MSDKKKYFDKLKEELKDVPLKERLLQELSDHLDDLEQEQADPLTTQKMSKIIGEPKYIKGAYYAILHPLRGLYFVAEGLFYGLLLLPFGLTSYIFLGRLMDVFYAPIQGGLSGLFIALLGLGLFGLLWFIGYSLAFRHWRKITQKTGYPLWVWVILVMLPSVTIWGSTIFMLFREFCTTCGEHPMRDLASIVASVVVIGVVLLIAGRLAWEKTKSPILRNKDTWIKRISFVLFLYLLSYGLLRTGASYGLFDVLSSQNSLFTSLFSPLFFLEFMALIFGTFLFSSLDGGIVHGDLAIALLGLILFFLIAQATVDVIKNKRVVWLRMGVASLALTLLLVNPQAYIPKVEWQKPAFAISENIEQEQHGILYGLLKYSNQDEGGLYRYQVEWSGEAFTVTQNSGQVFSIDPTELNEDKYEEIVDLAQSVAEFKESKIALPESMKCFSKNSAAEGLLISDFYFCNTLMWKGENIFAMEHSTTITDLALSEDGKWLMLVIQTGAYDPEYVYLVEF